MVAVVAHFTVQVEVALHAAHHFRGENAGQCGVFAEGFLHAAPTGFACNVDDRTVAYVSTLCTDFGTHGLAHAEQHVAVEGGSLAQRGGEYGGAYGHMAVRRFLSHHDGNAETGLLDCITLHHVEHLCREGRVESGGQRLLGPGVGTEHCPIVADVLLVGVFVELFREAHLAFCVLVVDEPSEGTAHLADFFVKGHA